MKTNRISLILLILFLLALTSCSAPDHPSGPTAFNASPSLPPEAAASAPPYIIAEADENGNLVIDTANITERASYANYQSGSSIVQLILVRGSDGGVRVSLNTCQACTPSPLAYFVQDGEWFICQNCLNAFSADQIGIEQGGCNPTPIEEISVSDGAITIPAVYLDQYSDAFANWQGPTA